MPPLREKIARVDYRARWAVIIGIGQYAGGQSGLEPLSHAVNDARKIRNRLGDEFGYADDHVRCLTDSDATLQSIKDAFERWIPAKSPQADDSVLVFFAGHGLIDRQTQQGYLAAVDSVAQKLDSCLPVAWLRDRLGEIPCRHKLVILDSCYSGSLFLEKPENAVSATSQSAVSASSDKRLGSGSLIASGAGTASDPTKDEFSYYLQEPFFWGMSAGRFQPVCDGQGDDQHSVFTAALLKVLAERADSGRSDHAFTFRQLASQVEARVRDAHVGQIPNWGRLAPGEGDFIFRPTVRGKTPREESSERELQSRRSRYSSTIKLVEQSLQKGDYHGANELLLAHVPAVGQEDVRSFEWAYLARIAESQQLLWNCFPLVVSSMDCSPDSRTLAVANPESSKMWGVRMVNAETGAVNGVLGGIDGIIWAVAFGKDGNSLATGGEDKLVRIWDLKTKVPRFVLVGHRATILSLAYSPDGKMLASADGDGNLRIWNSTSGEPKKTLHAHAGAVKCIRFSPNGKLLASGGDDKTIRLWSTDSFTEDGVLRGHSGEIESLAFSYDGKMLASGGQGATERDGEVVFWDVGSVKELNKLEFKSVVRYVACSTKGALCAAALSDGSVWLWDVTTGGKAAELRGYFSRSATLHGLSQKVTSLCFAPNGRSLATAEWTGFVRVWNLDKALERESIVGRDYFKYCAVSPDGKLVAAVNRLGSYDISLWDVASRQRRPSLKGHKGYIKSLAFSPDGKLIASGGDDKMVRVWNSCTGESLGSIQANSTIHAVAFLANGSEVAITTAGGPASLWDISRGKRRLTLSDHGNAINSIAVSPDGKLLATGSSDATVTLWDAISGNEQRVLKGHVAGVISLAISTDGKTLASGSIDGNVVLWDCQTGQKRQTIGASSSDARSLAFSPDGRTLAVGTGMSQLVGDSKFGSLKLFDPFTGQERMSLSEELISVENISFSRDGRMLIWASGGSIHFAQTFPYPSTSADKSAPMGIVLPSELEEALVGEEHEWLGFGMGNAVVSVSFLKEEGRREVIIVATWPHRELLGGKSEIRSVGYKGSFNVPEIDQGGASIQCTFTRRTSSTDDEKEGGAAFSPRTVTLHIPARALGARGLQQLEMDFSPHDKGSSKIGWWTTERLQFQKTKASR